MKRSRGDFEKSQRPEYVLFGTPLPAYDSDARDDGSYQPLWKQEVRDERGLKRLHGAFTGGFSAGYFNTVGSKEGWTPSTFVSSRSNRNKDVAKPAEQKPEDFMDDEDLADAAEAQKIQTAEGFSGMGGTENDEQRRAGLMDLFKSEGETMGVKLLKKMGWREGQGIGPKVRRKARSELDTTSATAGGHDQTYMFAPENTMMVRFLRKTDHKGLGFDGEDRLESAMQQEARSKLGDEEDSGFGTAAVIRPKKKKAARGGIGIGILNDTGSDDEDPYEVGPRMSYNKVIGGDKKKKKPVVDGAARPVFISKKAASAKAAANLRKCHDGRLPLDGFVLSHRSNPLSSISMPESRHKPPAVPEGWRSAKTPLGDLKSAAYISSSDAAKASKLDPKSRAALLGEAALPGKSVFDFLSAAARDRLAAASGKSNLPAALGEIPAGYNLTEEERFKELQNQIPKVDKIAAVAALGRGASGWMPYADDERKRDRYRSYLEIQAGIRNGLPDRGSNVSQGDWMKELQEFANCAQIFKPMTGMMANRFTSSSSTKATDAPSSAENLLSKPAAKSEDPAEAAAKMGMYGPMTRSSQDFFPTRLLCKRFDVRPPAHVTLDPERSAEDGGGITTRGGQAEKDLDLIGKDKIDDMMKEHWDTVNTQRAAAGKPPAVMPEKAKEITVEPDRNEALEKEKPGAAVFRAIFGDSDDDDDD